MADGDDFLVVAACGGLPWNPAWFHNLKARPEATVDVDGQRTAVRGVEVTGDDRDRVRPTMVANVATLEKSEELAKPREIPLMRLVRA